jgi:F-type H+-transporting ATPase subunit b
MLPRIGNVIDGRQEKTTWQAEAVRAATAHALRRYEEALADARSKANGLVNAARDGIEADSGEERAKTEALISAKVSAAERRFAEAKAKVLVNVEDIALDVAGRVVAHLSGKEVSKADVERALVRRAAELVLAMRLGHYSR